MDSYLGNVKGNMNPTVGFTCAEICIESNFKGKCCFTELLLRV